MIVPIFHKMTLNRTPVNLARFQIAIADIAYIQQNLSLLQIPGNTIGIFAFPKTRLPHAQNKPARGSISLRVVSLGNHTSGEMTSLKTESSMCEASPSLFLAYTLHIYDIVNRDLILYYEVE